jgi:hypothetical protein
MARIDAPFLNEVNITFFNQLNFNIPHLSRTISQMEVPKSANSAMPCPLEYTLSSRITCADMDWQVSSIIPSMAQIYHQASLFSNVSHLENRADCIRKEKEMDWLEFLNSFSSGKLRTAHIRGIGPAARRACFGRRRRGSDPGGVLPELRMLLFECYEKPASVEHFVATRNRVNL